MPGQGIAFEPVRVAAGQRHNTSSLRRHRSQRNSGPGSVPNIHSRQWQYRSLLFFLLGRRRHNLFADAVDPPAPFAGHMENAEVLIEHLVANVEIWSDLRAVEVFEFLIPNYRISAV